MGDRRGLIWVGHGPDLVEAFLVAAADALVLAQVLIPGADDELLKNAPGVGRVAPYAPTDGAGAASGETPGVQRRDQLLLKPGPGPVLKGHLHRPVSRCRVGDVRGGPVAGRQ